jgi:hypothetical protein
MKWELRRIEPIRAANVVAVFYFIMFAVFALPTFFFVGATPPQQNLDPAQQETFERLMQFFMLGYPFLGAIFGWIFTAFGAALYNVLAPRLGGVMFELGEAGPQARSVA